jgi:hypothetical protein
VGKVEGGRPKARGRIDLRHVGLRLFTAHAGQAGVPFELGFTLPILTDLYRETGFRRGRAGNGGSGSIGGPPMGTREPRVVPGIGRKLTEIGPFSGPVTFGGGLRRTKLMGHGMRLSHSGRIGTKLNEIGTPHCTGKAGFTTDRADVEGARGRSWPVLARFGRTFWRARREGKGATAKSEGGTLDSS